MVFDREIFGLAGLIFTGFGLVEQGFILAGFGLSGFDLSGFDLSEFGLSGIGLSGFDLLGFHLDDSACMAGGVGCGGRWLG